MRIRILVSALLLSICGAAAQAQPHVGIGTKAPMWDDSKETLRQEGDRLPILRDKIFVLLFWRTNNSESVEALTTLNDIHKSFGKLGVTAMAYAPEPKEKVDPVLKGKKVEYITIWREGKGTGLEGAYNVTSYPRVYIIDTNGIIAWIGHPADNLEDRVRKQMAKTPPAGASSAVTKSRLERAEAAFRKDDFARAHLMAHVVRDAVEKETPLYTTAKTLMEKCEEGAKKWVTQAAEDYRAEKFDESAKRVAAIIVFMPNTDAAKSAEEEANKLRGNLKSKTIIKNAIDNAKGEVRIMEALEFESLEQYPEALVAYQDVADKYKNTEAAKTAEAAIKRYKEDASLSKKIRDKRSSEDSERWLDLGDRFAKMELNVQARKYYDEIIKLYPASDAAKRAKERLAKLPKEDGPDPMQVAEKPKKEEKKEDPKKDEKDSTKDGKDTKKDAGKKDKKDKPEDKP